MKMKGFNIFRKKEVEDFQVEKEVKKEQSYSLKNILNLEKVDVNWVIKQVPFVVFVVGLLVVYISNRYGYEEKVREISKLKKKRNELRAEHISTASELMVLSKQSEILKLIDTFNINLEENTEPPIKLIVKKEEGN